jgi:hypothetical protein
MKELFQATMFIESISRNRSALADKVLQDTVNTLLKDISEELIGRMF